jgi:hypothetical protein
LQEREQKMNLNEIEERVAILGRENWGWHRINGSEYTWSFHGRLAVVEALTESLDDTSALIARVRELEKGLAELMYHVQHSNGCGAKARRGIAGATGPDLGMEFCNCRLRERLAALDGES